MLTVDRSPRPTDSADGDTMTETHHPVPTAMRVTESVFAESAGAQ